MAIQNRRGAYTDFDPSRMLPGEYAIVLSGDPSDEDGYAVYMCFASGVVKRLVLSEQMEAAIDAIMDDLQYDDVPTANSQNLLTSGTIKTALDGKQNTLTFDNTPTANSNNPVKSGGVKSSLTTLQALINRIIPEWTSGTLYPAGSLVFHDNLVYRKKDITAMTEYTFSANNWEEVNASAFLTNWLRTFAAPYQDKGVSYAVGDLCINNAQLYICITPITGSWTSHPFDTSEWRTTSFLSQFLYCKDQISNLQENKQNVLTFDNTPTANSDNPVKSGGIKTALDGKQNTLTFDNTPTANSDNPVKSGGIYDALASLSTVSVDANGVMHF